MTSNGSPHHTRQMHTRFPNDRLGRAAKEAFADWKAGLSDEERRKLRKQPRRRKAKGGKGGRH